jgi:VWFA-related protein
VRDIERDRFHVLLDGRELHVVAFEELSVEPKKRERRRAAPGSDAASREGAAPLEQDAGRSILVVVDTLWTPRQYALDSVRAVRDTLDALGAADQAAICALGVEAKLVQPFTSDRELLASALDLLEASFEADAQKSRETWERFVALRRDDREGSSRWLGLRGALALDSEIGRSLSTLPDPTFRAIEPGGPGASGRFRDETEGDSADFASREQEQVGAVAQAAASSTEALSNLVRLLSDVPGPRYALLLSRGMPNFTTVLEDGIGSGDPRISRSGAGSSLLGHYQALAYVLEGHGFVVQAFDVTGVGSRALATGFSTVDVAPRPELDPKQLGAIPDLALRGGLTGDGSDSLFFLAHETGGELYDNYNRLETALRTAYESTSHFYRVVVSLPADPSFFEKRRRQTLQVRIDELPARVRVTSSMAADWSLPGFLRRDEKLDTVRADLLGEGTASPLRPGEARLVVMRQRVEGAPRLQRAIVLLDVSTGALAPHLAGEDAELTAHAIALPLQSAPGATGEFLDLAAGSVSWSVTDDARERLLFVADLLVPCEGARIRVRLADATQEHSWVLEHALDPACDEAPAWFVPLRDESVIFGLEEDLDVDDTERNPLGVGSAVMAPAPRATTRAGERLELLFRPQGESLEEAEGGRVEFRNVATGNTRVLPFEILSPAPGRGTFLAALTLDLEPGVYEATLAGGTSDGSAVFAVLP